MTVIPTRAFMGLDSPITYTRIMNIYVRYLDIPHGGNVKNVLSEVTIF